MLGFKNKNVLKLLGFIGLMTGSAALYAASGVSGAGIGAVAATVKTNFDAIAKLITAGAYVAGLGFGVGAILKFKAHKDNPTQVQLSVPISMLFIAAALMASPSVFKSAGKTLYATGGEVGSVSGISRIEIGS